VYNHEFKLKIEVACDVYELYSPTIDGKVTNEMHVHAMLGKPMELKAPHFKMQPDCGHKPQWTFTIRG